MNKGDSFATAIKSIEDRYGVSFIDYLGTNGKRSAETQAKMDKALRKETFKIKLDQ